MEGGLQIRGLRILRWAHGGDGVGVPDDGPLKGAVVFVPASVPGDVVDATVTVHKKRWARARLTRLVTPSPERVSPACGHQEVCGGCPWMVGSAEAQRTSRLHVLRSEARKRLGWDAPVAERRVQLAPDGGSRLGYRVRARLAYDRGPGPGVRLGYRGRASHAVVDVQRCVVLAEGLQRAWPQLRSALDARGGRGGEVDLLLGEEGWAARVRPVGGAPYHLGPERVTVPQGAVSPRCRPEAFVQANPAALEALLEEVSTLASAVGGEHAVELFAGSGVLTAPLLASGYQVDAYEIADGAREAFEGCLADLGEARFHRCDLLGDGVPRPRAQGAVDLVLLDPPRTGAAAVMPWVRACGARAVIYVGCDPATALRDLSLLREGAWEVCSLTGYDMFPHTGHQEVVAFARATAT